MNEIARLVASLLVVLAGSVALAQEIDPRARELLEGIGGYPEEVRTFQASWVMTYHGGLDGFGTMTSHIVIDVENRRLAGTFERAGGAEDPMNFDGTIRLVDGELTMVMMGMEVPAPPELVETYEAMFDQYGTTDPLAGIERATFDGPVDYGGLLVGDQVSIEGDVSLPNVAQVGVFRYVFAADGTLLGAHSETEVGEVLVLFEGMSGGLALPGASMRTYQLVDGAWQLAIEMRYEDVIVNAEIDEGLFR